MNFLKDKLSCCEKIFSRLLYPYCNQQPGGHLEERNQCLRTWGAKKKKKNYLGKEKGLKIYSQKERGKE